MLSMPVYLPGMLSVTEAHVRPLLEGAVIGVIAGRVGSGRTHASLEFAARASQMTDKPILYISSDLHIDKVREGLKTLGAHGNVACCDNYEQMESAAPFAGIPGGTKLVIVDGTQEFQRHAAFVLWKELCIQRNHISVLSTMQLLREEGYDPDSKWVQCADELWICNRMKLSHVKSRVGEWTADISMRHWRDTSHTAHNAL